MVFDSRCRFHARGNVYHVRRQRGNGCGNILRAETAREDDAPPGAPAVEGLGELGPWDRDARASQPSRRGGVEQQRIGDVKNLSQVRGKSVKGTLPFVRTENWGQTRF